ncbi:hypothetical protein SH501x_000972 [Pirellulaceae bacterium SH501]
MSELRSGGDEAAATEAQGHGEIKGVMNRIGWLRKRIRSESGDSRASK